MAEAHIRIDEGIPRGPRIPRQSVPKRRDDETGRVEGIPPNLDPQSVLELYMASRSTSHIAKQFNVKRKTLVGWLREKVPLQWKQVQILRALVRKEASEDEIEVAKDAISLARARETLKAAQWDLERVDSENYGVKQQISLDVDLRVQVSHQLTSKASDLLSKVRGAVQPPMIEVNPAPSQSGKE